MLFISCIAPISLLTCIIETNTVSLHIASFKSSRDIFPSLSTSKYVTLTSEQPEVQYPATAVANHDVYVRNGGSPKAKKLGAITKGTKVTVVEKCQYNWYKIQYKGGFGYVYGEYLDIVLVQK